MEPRDDKSLSFPLWGLLLVIFDLIALFSITLGRSIWMDHGIPPSSAPLGRMLFGVFAASSLITAAVLYVCRRRIAVGGRNFFTALGLMTAVIFGAAILLQPIGSVDNYWNTLMSRGWTQYGQNPYLTTPNDLSLDPIFPRTAREWRNTGMMYGPLWVLAAAAPTSVLTKAAPAILGMKTLVSAGYLASGLLLFAYLRRRKDPRANLFLAAWCLNPMGFFEAANAGHNEGLLVLPLAILAIGLLEKRPRLILPGLTAAVLIKIWPACLLPAIFGIKGARRRDWFYGTAMSAAMVFIAFAAFWHGWEIFRPLFGRLSDLNTKHFSPGYYILSLATLGPAGWSTTENMGVVTFFAALALLLGAGLAGYLAWRGKMTPTGAIRFIMAVFLLIFLNWLQPWYLLALLPFMLPSGNDAGGLIFLSLVAGLGVLGFASYAASWALVTALAIVSFDIGAIFFFAFRAARFLARKKEDHAAD